MPTTDTTHPVRMTSQMKEDLKITGNIGGYMKEAARQRLQRYRDARETLRAAEWGQNEIKACLDVLNGTNLTFSAALGEQIAAVMEDAAQLDAIHERWSIYRTRWDEMAGQVRTQEPIARALHAVAREYSGTAARHVDV